MNEDFHTHQRTDELTVFWVPVGAPGEVRVIKNNFQTMQTLVGGYLEQLRTTGFPELQCGCSLAMFGNEDAKMKMLPPNAQVTAVCDYLILGDVFLVGEGLVSFAGKTAADDEVEPDLFSLPQCFSTWQGPGYPIPTDKQPWEAGYGD